jgi:DNA-binding response OmpR family regulator
MDGNPTALIVEDEYDISLIFAKALRAAGFDADIVHSGSEAMKWLASTVPHIVVLDLQMPKVAGTEVLQYIRSDPRLEGVCVIIATAYPHMAEGLHEEADWVFFKPVSFAQLRDMAARLGDTVTGGKAEDES